jgi:hypothetical protein
MSECGWADAVRRLGLLFAVHGIREFDRGVGRRELPTILVEFFALEVQKRDQ